MRFDPPLVPAAFLGRRNRYLAEVVCGASPEGAHVPNSGRMSELLVPGRPAWVSPAQRPGRKTAWDLVLIEHEGRWVSVDARLPPRLLQEALARDPALLPGFPSVLQREVSRDGSRFDLSGTAPDGRVCFVEAKSVNLVEGGRALFPDAPTARGARHCRHLAALAARGCRTAIVFVVQREDAAVLSPHRAADPAFADALAAAAEAGVLLRALRCRVTPEAISPVATVPVVLQ